MKKLISAIFFIIIAGFSISADAAPSFNGATGMINTPTADVLRKGQFSLGVYSMKEGQNTSFTVNLAPNLEVGWSGYHYKASSDLANANCFSAKYALISENVLSPGIAVGVEDIGNEQRRSWYVAASKGLIFGLRLHAGFGNGRYDGFFGSLEKSILPVSIGGVGGVNLIAEWDGSQFNYGLRMSVLPGLKVDAGMRKKNAYVGVSFTK